MTDKLTSSQYKSLKNLDVNASSARNTLGSTQGSMRTSANTERTRISQRKSLNAMEDILADDTLGRD